MKVWSYYNEWDANAAAWLRELMARKLIPQGHVDERSITEVSPADLDGFTQCHFFAGIGIWPLALQLAGYPADRSIWSASLPCQPFSEAGEGKGAEDDRHLFPVFRRLVQVKRPVRLIGEQVAAAIGFDWLDGISTELEADGYTVGSIVLGAFSVGAPHIRRRLYWVANAENRDRGSELEPRSGRDGLAGGAEHARGLADPQRDAGCSELEYEARGRQDTGPPDAAERGGNHGRVGNAVGPRLEGHAGDGRDGDQPGRINPDEARPVAKAGAVVRRLGDTTGGGLGELGDAARARCGGHADGPSGASDPNGLGNTDRDGRMPGQQSTTGLRHGDPVVATGCGTDGMVNSEHDGGRTNEPRRGPEGRASDGRTGGWDDSRLILCRDGKHRRIPVEPAFFPLADAGIYVVPGLARRRTVRPALLKGSGNAIVAETAAEFIRAIEEVIPQI